MFHRDDEVWCREGSDSRVERGYPPLTPAACLRDSILSAVFDDLMSKVTLIPLYMGSFSFWISLLLIPNFGLRPNLT